VEGKQRKLRKRDQCQEKLQESIVTQLQNYFRKKRNCQVLRSDLNFLRVLFVCCYLVALGIELRAL
jgi:hypothetical protein